MILGYHVLKSRLDELFPIEQPVKIGASSIDVTIGVTAQHENGVQVDLSEFDETKPYLLSPNEFLLVAMLEHTRVPRDLSASFYLKSTRARQGYGHALAAWIDPGWDGRLTMELKNYNEHTPLPLWPGMPIGQIVFWQTVLAGNYHGRYQNDDKVSGAKKEIMYDAGREL